MKKSSMIITAVAAFGGLATLLSLPDEALVRRGEFIEILDERPNDLTVQETQEMHRLIDETCPGEKRYQGQATVRTVQDFLRGNCLQ